MEMAAQRIRDIGEQAYLLLVSFFLLWDVFYMTEAAWTFAIRPVFPVLAGVGTALALGLARGKTGAAYLPLGLLGWMALSSLMQGTWLLAAQQDTLVHGLIAFGVILPAPLAVSRRRMMRCLRALLFTWTACFTLQALLGLWAAITGHAVFSLRGTWYIGMNLGDGRLYLNAYVTTAAAKLGLSVLLALLGGAMAKTRAGQFACALCALIQLLCLSLTDCRTAFIALGAALGGMAALLLRKKPGKTVQRILISAACVALTAAVTYLTLSGVMNALGPQLPRTLDNITLTEIPGHLLPSAAAEAAAHRPIDAQNVFNGRSEIWKAALRLLRHHPRYLLTGTTASQAKPLINLYTAPEVTLRYDHVHSIYLQVLVCWGLPGLALLGCMLLRLGKSALSIFGRGPLRQRLTPLCVMYVLLCEAADCFTRLSALPPVLLWACLLSGMMLRAEKEDNL